MNEVQSLGGNTIMVVVELHIVGAFHQHFIAKKDILQRMLR